MKNKKKSCNFCQRLQILKRDETEKKKLLLNPKSIKISKGKIPLQIKRVKRRVQKKIYETHILLFIYLFCCQQWFLSLYEKKGLFFLLM